MASRVETMPQGALTGREAPPRGGVLGRLLRDPLVVFLVIGGAFFLAYWALNRGADRIEVPAATQAQLAEEYEAITGRKPSPADRARLLQDFVTNEVLFREAIDRGMHLTDKQTKQRMIDKLRFLIAGSPAEPREEELVNFYAEHLPLYRAEPKISFRHIFFEDAPADPAATLATLRAGGQIAGDDFWMGREFTDYGESMVRGLLGAEFLKAVRAAPAAEWIGPIASSRGVHFVRVEGKRAPSLMPFPQVRDQVKQDYGAAQTRAAVDGEMEKLKERYDVVIEK